MAYYRLYYVGSDHASGVNDFEAAADEDAIRQAHAKGVGVIGMKVAHAIATRCERTREEGKIQRAKLSSIRPSE